MHNFFFKLLKEQLYGIQNNLQNAHCKWTPSLDCVILEYNFERYIIVLDCNLKYYFEILDYTISNKTLSFTQSKKLPD